MEGGILISPNRKYFFASQFIYYDTVLEHKWYAFEMYRRKGLQKRILKCAK